IGIFFCREGAPLTLSTLFSATSHQKFSIISVEHQGLFFFAGKRRPDDPETIRVHTNIFHESKVIIAKLPVLPVGSDGIADYSLAIALDLSYLKLC
ncbi:hypothetical protein M8C21_026748, partial [Ambrosia artemisiifolia]